MDIFTKKPLAEFDRRGVILLTEVLILYVLNQEEGSQLTAFEISSQVSTIKHGGKKEVQITGSLRQLESRGVIRSRRLTDDESERKTVHYRITPKGQKVLRSALNIIELLSETDD